MNNESWINNPALGGIDPAKLQMLAKLVEQAQGKKQNEMLPFLMAAASQSKTNHMSFDSSETDAIINVMKLGKSPQETARIDQMYTLFQQLQNVRSKTREPQ